MKLTIIKDDKAVYKDVAFTTGQTYNGKELESDTVIKVCYLTLTLNTIPDGVHALQWEDTIGHIEYTSNSQSNETITSLPTWADDAANAWDVAHAAEG